MTQPKTLVLAGVSVVIKHYNQKQYQRKRVYLILTAVQVTHTPLLIEVRERTQGRSLKTGTEAEATTKCCLLTFSTRLIQPIHPSIQKGLNI